MANESALREAEREIVEGMTAAAGVAAQRYEPRTQGGISDPDGAMVARLKSEGSHRRSTETVERTFGAIGEYHVWVLRLAYGKSSPFGSCNELLAAALNGADVSSLSALAPLTARAQRFAARERPGVDVPHHDVIRLLERAAGAGASFIREVRTEAAVLRDEALAEYAEARHLRMRADAAAAKLAHVVRQKARDDAYRAQLAGRA